MLQADKQYGRSSRVMERLEVQNFDWNYDRYGGLANLTYREEKYRFEHTSAKTKPRGENLQYDRDAFVQSEYKLGA